METTEEKRLFTREEAAKRLRISLSTLDRMRHAGEIHDTHISERRVAIAEAELNRFLRDRS